MLCYPKGASTIPNETIVIDMKSKAVSVYSYAFSCFSVWDKKELRLFGGSNTEGRVYELETGTTDDTASITCYDSLDPLDFGIPDRLKNYYSIFIKCKTTTGTGLKVYYQTDDNDEASVDTPENAVVANKDRWYRFRLPSGVRGRTLKIRPYISDAYDVTFKGIMIEFDIEALQP